eukprot:gene10294-18993_t
MDDIDLKPELPVHLNVGASEFAKIKTNAKSETSLISRRHEKQAFLPIRIKEEDRDLLRFDKEEWKEGHAVIELATKNTFAEKRDVLKRCSNYLGTTIYTDRKLQHNRPDTQEWTLIDKAVPAGQDIIKTEDGKLTKYQNLAIEIKRQHRALKVTVIPIVIGALGAISKNAKDLS